MVPKYQDPYLSSVEEGLSLAHQKMLLFLWYEEVRGNIVVLIWYIFHSFTSNPSIEEDTICKVMYQLGKGGHRRRYPENRQVSGRTHGR